jgi:hypothetical protein
MDLRFKKFFVAGIIRRGSTKGNLSEITCCLFSAGTFLRVKLTNFATKSKLVFFRQVNFWKLCFAKKDSNRHGSIGT